MRCLNLLPALLLIALTSAQAPPPPPAPPASSSPPSNEPPKIPAPAPPGPMSNPPSPAQPSAAAPAAPAFAKPAAISMKEGASVDANAPRTHDVIVGGPTSKLSFLPESILAKSGDTVRFMFMDSENSVMQTTFETPCAAKAGGFSAGPMVNAAGKVPGPVQELKIAGTETLWMTSKAAGACGRGMLFVVNAPTAGNQTASAFKMAAIKAGGVQFSNDALVVDQPAPQIASTITVNPAGNAGNVAAGQTPAAGQSLPQGTVIPGQGTLGNGQPCGCQCLCGPGQAPPAGAGQGSFGGVAGINPNAIGSMQPPPAGRP